MSNLEEFLQNSLFDYYFDRCRTDEQIMRVLDVALQYHLEN